MKHLVLGGARSGKSIFAEQIATTSDLEIIYIATALIDDEEMRNRISIHQQRRPEHWALIEEPIQLGKILNEENAENKFVLIDSLALWLKNLLYRKSETLLMKEHGSLVTAVEQFRGQLVIVSNENSLGLSPVNDLAQKYIDINGKLHQYLAAICDRVTLVVAGLPLTLKE